MGFEDVEFLYFFLFLFYILSFFLWLVFPNFICKIGIQCCLDLYGQPFFPVLFIEEFSFSYLCLYQINDCVSKLSPLFHRKLFLHQKTFNYFNFLIGPDSWFRNSFSQFLFLCHFLAISLHFHTYFIMVFHIFYSICSSSF